MLKTLKKGVALFLGTLMCLAALVSCGNGKPAEGSHPDTSTPPETTGITVYIGDAVFEVNALNNPYDGHDVAMYDRNYIEDNAFALYAPGDNAGRFVVIIRYSESGGKKTYSIDEIYDGKSSKQNIYIPVNGFVLSADYKAVPSEFSPKKTAAVSVNGYDERPVYERFDLASVIPEDLSKARRVNLYAPDDGNFAEDKIYLIKEENSAVVPENSVAVILKGGSGSYYSLNGVLSPGETVSGTYALLFTGSYNKMYAEKFYKEGKVYFSRLDSLNSLTDNPAVKLGGAALITFDDDHYNKSGGEDGVFIYTPENASLITDKRKSFLDIVVVDGKAVYIGKDNTPTLIPTSGGFVLTFAGNAKEKGEAIGLGDNIEGLLIPAFKSPDSFVRMGGNDYAFTSVNNYTVSADTVTLYTDLFGNSTKTAKGFSEITIKDGKILSLSLEGDSVIPKDGYVLSIPIESTKLYNYSKRLTDGEDALISFGGNNYGYVSFPFTAVNGVRNTNFMVIYDGKAGKSTGTNIYGYEIAVNAEGKIVEDGYAGDMPIPTGGFVISAHGDSIPTLESIYKPGASVTYDQSDKSVTLLVTPDLNVFAAAQALEEEKAAFQKAKDNFYSIDYPALAIALESIEEKLGKAGDAYDAGDVDKAIELAAGVSGLLDTLRFMMFESAPVENRAVWYRAGEKSDEEVLRSVTLMSEMNLNAIYIEAWYNGLTIGYSDIDLIDHNTKAHGEYDALEGFCRIAHEYGIEVHVWVENFFIGLSGGKLVEATRGHHLLDSKGRGYQTNMYGDFIFLNPYEKASQDLILDVYREMLVNYDIDGLHLDYIRFLNPNPDGSDFGYNDDIIAGFQEVYNTTVNPKTLSKSGKDWENWCLFRESIINDWVATVYEMAKEVRPDINISCAVANDYPGSRKTIFQNFNDWVQKEYMDEVFSMSYCSNLKTPAANINTFTGYTKGKAFFTIGLSAFESSPNYILVGQVQVARDSGAHGENLFSWGSLIKHSENYFNALIAGVYSKKAAKADSLSNAVTAYAARLLDDIDAVYTYLAPLSDGFYDSLKEKVTALLNHAKEFDLENATTAEKRDYCNSAIDELTELSHFMSACQDAKAAAALVKGAEFIIDCLTTSEVRLGK